MAAKKKTARKTSKKVAKKAVAKKATAKKAPAKKAPAKKAPAKRTPAKKPTSVVIASITPTKDGASWTVKTNTGDAIKLPTGAAHAWVAGPTTRALQLPWDVCKRG
jgi:mannose-6-phosphate isomerase class I